MPLPYVHIPAFANFLLRDSVGAGIFQYEIVKCNLNVSPNFASATSTVA